MEQFAQSSAITAAFIGGALSLFGLLIKSIYDSWESRRLYAERREDMQKAIYAEISAFVTLQELNQLGKFGEEVVAKIKTESFQPFLIREKHNAVYESQMKDIHYLPKETIDIITRYYQRLAFVYEIKEAMMGDRFAQLPDDRRALLYRHYIATMRFALFEGKEALRAIEVFTTDGKDGLAQMQREAREETSKQTKLEVKAWLETHKNQ